MIDFINADEIQNTTNTKFIGKNIIFLDEVDSTNNFAKSIIKYNMNEGTIVIANTQTNGRGRFGRYFYSPDGHGIYMSLILYPKMHIENISILTIISSLAVANTIKKIIDPNRVNIKWINDILIDQKKVCGILVESGIRGSEVNRTLSYVIIGFGINYYFPIGGFPSIISEKATAIFDSHDNNINRNIFISHLLFEFETLYNNLDFNIIIESYKSYLNILNKYVDVVYFDTRPREQVFCIDINNLGHLIVKDNSGFIKTLRSAEISIKLRNR